MGYHVPYEGKTITAPDELLPGNSVHENPLAFDIVPAWGADLARLKSIQYASIGLVQDQAWTPEVQQSVIASFAIGADAFVNTVTAIRGLTVPSAMALRAGLLVQLPQKATDRGLEPDPQAAYAVMTGVAFSKVAGALTSMALWLCFEIIKISDKAEAELDPRFFGQPSGSGGTDTARKGKATNATTARRQSRRRGTVASDSTPAGA